jgi:Flp pilus assembly protein TadD
VPSLSCTGVEEHRARLYTKVDRALAEGRVEHAAELLEAHLRWDPRDSDVAVRWARLELERGNDRRPLRILTALPADSPRNDDYLDALTRATLAAGSLEEATALLARRPSAEPELVEELLRRSVTSPWLELQALPDDWRAGRIELLLRAGHYGAASQQLLHLPREHPRAASLIDACLLAALDADDTALLAATPGLDLEPPSVAVLLVRRHLALLRGDNAAAERAEQRLLTEHPTHPERFAIVLERARRANRAGEPAAALASAREASALDSDSSAPLLEQALAQIALEDPRAALASLRQVLALEPEHAVARDLSASLQRELRPNDSSRLVVRLADED